MSSLGLPIHIKYIWHARNPHTSWIISSTLIYICYAALQTVSRVIR